MPRKLPIKPELALLTTNPALWHGLGVPSVPGHLSNVERRSVRRLRTRRAVLMLARRQEAVFM